MTTRLLSEVTSRKIAVAALSCCPIFFYSHFQERAPTLNECHQHEGIDKESDVDKSNATFYGQCLKRQLHHPTLPYPAWDYNWDGRMTPATSPDVLRTAQGLQQSRQGKIRHILFIRHGQYDETSKDDEKRKLTHLGRRQAHLTGQRLSLIARGGLGGIDERFAGACRIKAIHMSDMARAKETAAIIATHLPSVKLMEPDPMLNEAIPAPIVPARPDVPNVEQSIDRNHDRIEAAFHKYMHRAEQMKDTEGVEHEFEIIVGHGNVIRYFFCRALQMPPEAWLRMSIFNCSITYIMILPNGYCAARMLGDIGHMGYDDITFSHSHGFNW